MLTDDGSNDRNDNDNNNTMATVEAATRRPQTLFAELVTMAREELKNENAYAARPHAAATLTTITIEEDT